MSESPLRYVHKYDNLRRCEKFNSIATPTVIARVEEFLDNLAPKQAQKIVWVLRLVRELPLVPKQYFKKLEGGDELWEVRAEFGGDAFRLLGFWGSGQLIILTNGFAKKSQKTPEREIVLAARRKRDYLNRKAKR